MNESKLLACPCGGEAELTEQNTDMNLSLKGVRCKKCGEAIPLIHDHAPEAIRAWNDWAGGRKPAMSKTAGVKALASATGSDARPPKRIWLQWDGDATEGSPLPMEKRGEVTWCGDKIFKRDVMYIRSDCVKRQNV